MRWAVITVLLCGVGVSCDRPPPPKPVAQPTKQVQDWTPDQIVAQPEQWLDFCQATVNSVIARLQSQQVTIESTRAMFQKDHDRESAAIREGQAVLKQLQELVQSTPEGGWPVTWAGAKRQKQWVLQSVADLEMQIASKSHSLGYFEKGLAQLREEQARIPRDLAAANQRLAEIKVQRGLLDVERQNEAYQKQLVAMQSQVYNVVHRANDSPITRLETLAEKQPIRLSAEGARP